MCSCVGFADFLGGDVVGLLAEDVELGGSEGPVAVLGRRAVVIVFYHRSDRSVTAVINRSFPSKV